MKRPLQLLSPLVLVLLALLAILTFSAVHLENLSSPLDEAPPVLSPKPEAIPAPGEPMPSGNPSTGTMPSADEGLADFSSIEPSAGDSTPPKDEMPDQIGKPATKVPHGEAKRPTDMIHKNGAGAVIENSDGIFHSPGPAAPNGHTVKFAGGHMRKAEITSSSPTPQAGLGLYVYLLPEREVDSAMLRALEKFHQCLSAPGVGEPVEAIALLLLPVRSTERTIDTNLAHDLIKIVLSAEDIDKKEVYLVATNQPLVADVTANTDNSGRVVIRLGRIAPQYAGTWLGRMQAEIEDGRISNPADLGLKLKSVFALVAETGSLFGVSPAQAEEYVCR